MINRIKLIGNSAFSIIAILIISCSMCTTAWSLKYYSEWNNTAITATLIGGIVLFAWLIWAAYVFCKKCVVKELEPKSRIIVQMLSGVLFMCWLYIIASPVVALIWLPMLIRSFKADFCKTA